MDECKLLCTLHDRMHGSTKSMHGSDYQDATTFTERLCAILNYQPGTLIMLNRQVMNFHKVMNRSTRGHDYVDYDTYAYAAVGNFFKVKFSLLANSEEEIPEIMVASIEYINDGTKLTCEFDAIRTKIKSAPATRNHTYAYMKYSFYNNFLMLTDMPTFENEEQVRMEIQDFLFDYTNLEELIENE